LRETTLHSTRWAHGRLGSGTWVCRDSDSDLGYQALHLKRAAESQEYCDEVLGVVEQAGLEVTELSTHLQGQLVATHSAYDELFAGFAPAELAGDLKARQAWAVDQLLCAAKASRRLD